MRLRDYFQGQPIVMQSRLRPDELERRINDATISRWGPFEKGVVGWARFGRIRLRFRPLFFEYNMSPILAGRIDDSSGPTRLLLSWRAPLPAYVFFALWYGFALLFLAFLLFGGASLDAQGGERLVPPLLLLLLALAPLGLHYLGTRNADAHLAELVSFVEKAGEAKVVSRGRRTTL